MNERKETVKKHKKKNILQKILKNTKIILEISKVIKEIHKLFW